MYKVEKINGKYKITAGRTCPCGWSIEKIDWCVDKKKILHTQDHLSSIINSEYEEHKKEFNHDRYCKLKRILKDD